jgi:hypothetical protein
MVEALTHLPLSALWTSASEVCIVAFPPLALAPATTARERLAPLPGREASVWSPASG